MTQFGKLHSAGIILKVFSPELRNKDDSDFDTQDSTAHGNLGTVIRSPCTRLNGEFCAAGAAED